MFRSSKKFSKILNPGEMIAFFRVKIPESKVRALGRRFWRKSALWPWILALSVVGCKESVMTKTLPAPIRDNIQYEMDGHVYRVWTGDSFEFGDTEELHCIMLRGIDAPNESHPFFLKSRNTLNGLIRLRKLRIKVVDRDEMMREVADVFVVDQFSVEGKEEFNVGLKMIQLGVAWYNGSEFDDAESFRQAQQEAREKRIGLWAQGSPLPQGEFESLQQPDENSKPDQSGSP